jgi:hypothetical protein
MAVKSALTPENGIKRMQLDYFKLYRHCVDQGILKEARRVTPSEAARRKMDGSLDQLHAAEGALVRLFSDMLRNLFGASPEKRRNYLEFIVCLPEGSWWMENGVIVRSIAHLGTEASAAYDRHVLFVRPEERIRHPWPNAVQRRNITRPHLLVAADDKLDASSWGRRRFETLDRYYRSSGKFYDAALCVLAMKERVDALMRAADGPTGGDDAEQQRQDPDRSG